MTHRRRTAGAAFVAASALVLTACGSDEPTDPETTTSSEVTPSEATPSETETESPTSEDTPEAGAADLTEPGTKLKLGETATIPQGDDGGSITVTVTSVDVGSADDLSELKEPEKYKDYTPVYVQYEMTTTEGSKDLGGDLLDDVDPILDNGRRAQSLIIIGTSPFEKCDRNSIPDDTTPGTKETTCDVALAAAGQTVAGAAYSPRDGDYADEGAITWTK